MGSVDFLSSPPVVFLPPIGSVFVKLGIILVIKGLILDDSVLNVVSLLSQLEELLLHAVILKEEPPVSLVVVSLGFIGRDTLLNQPSLVISQLVFCLPGLCSPSLLLFLRPSPFLVVCRLRRLARLFQKELVVKVDLRHD